MTGVIGALVALGVVGVLVAGLAVRPPARGAKQALAELRADTAVRWARLRELRPARRSRASTGDPVVPAG